MFSHSRMNSDGLYTKEMTGPSSSTQLGVPSHEPGSQDSSWIGFFSSMISRPNFSFLQRYLLGRPQTQSQSSSGTGWISGEFQQSLACEHMFLARLEEDWMQTEHRPHVGLLHYQNESNYCIGGGQEPFSLLSTGTSLDWFTKDGLGVMGIHCDTDMDMYSKDPVPANAYVSAARHCLNQVLVNVISAQDAKSGSEVLTGKKGQIIERENSTWVSTGQVKRSWWGHFWGTDYNNTPGSGAQGVELSGRSGPVQQSKEKDSTGIHQQLQPSPVAAVPNPPVHIVQREGAPLCAENAGYQFHKERPPDNASSQTALPETFLSEKPLLAFGRPCACAAVTATATFSTEAVVLTPDQDNGYSSWEEEHFGSKSHKMEACCSSQASSEAVKSEQQSCGEVEEPLSGVSSGTMGPEGEMEQRDTDATLACDDSNVEAQIEVASQSLPVLTSPQCQNKTIAFIMGAPCSQESESESELDQDWDSEDDDDDDDGFSSEGSSDFSESEEDDTDEEEGGIEEAEKERLWNSFSQSRDPYNPQNFTTAIQTVKPRAPFEEDATTTEEEVTEAECSSGSQSPWNCEDDHSSCDEAESLKLWNSFSCRGDPYNPLNFMVPISTKQGGEWCSAPLSSKQKAGRRAPSPSMQMEEAEERLDSGFSETWHIEQAQKTSNRCGKQKKVMFVDEVEEFYASCDEDRRGPWEELARDRCRFLRRVQETEDTVGCCLAPAHRQKVFERLYEKC